MVVGSLSAFTAVLYFIPFIIRFRAVLVWNVILFILWIALFGLFGNVRPFPHPCGLTGELSPECKRLG